MKETYNNSFNQFLSCLLTLSSALNLLELISAEDNYIPRLQILETVLVLADGSWYTKSVNIGCIILSKI